QRSSRARPIRLPVRLRLPSGARASVRASERPRPTPPTLRGAIEALSGAAVEVLDGRGATLPASELPLEDFHVLRALVTRAGLLEEGPQPVECANCGHHFRARPCDHVEFGPFLDDELTDPELDDPFDFLATHPLLAPPEDGNEGDEGEGGKSESNEASIGVRLRPLRVGRVTALYEALEGDELVFTPALVKAMGVQAFGGETDPAAVAAAIEAADDETLSDLLGLFDAAHYPPRLRAPVRCESCGALVRVDAPALREFPAESGRREGRGESTFLSEGAFTKLARSVGGPLLERRGAGGVALVIETGPAACDDGGVTLLGSYVPGEPEAPGVPARLPEITLYYRTFRAQHDDEGPFDVEAEIVDTLEHELDHHEAFLRGDDPVDEEERSEIAREARREVGETETLRRASRALRSELGDFAYRTWPFWLLAALVTYLLAR
ncbi:MAG TPA: hypothetical protein VFS00_04800, partial [Polyangiaceae bacterium]|nr:hypothetical protein [Polyangiaceae bacterium]